MTPNDFASRTRKQRQEFDNIRSKALELTPIELAQQAKKTKENTITMCKECLKSYGIVFTGLETDFKELWKSYILGGGSPQNIPMNEWLGNDTRLQEIVEDKCLNHNNFDSFTNFILQYQ